VSSPTYSTELQPDPRLRRIVLLCGIVALLAGLVLLLTLRIALHWRVLAAVAWLAVNIRRLFVIANGYKRCRRIRIEHTGTVTIQAADGCWIPATFVPGSVVLANVAWLRCKAEDGRQFAELFNPKCTRDEGWRRLQVIWRHIGAGR
jgi:hypothetical protein